jgi:hypothetical protein
MEKTSSLIRVIREIRGQIASSTNPLLAPVQKIFHPADKFFPGISLM